MVLALDFRHSTFDSGASSVCTEEAPDNRQECHRAAVPFGGPIHPGLERLTHGRIEYWETLFEVDKTFAGFSKSWHQLLIQKHGDKWPELQLGRVAGDTLTIGLAWDDGVEFH